MHAYYELYVHAARGAIKIRSWNEWVTWWPAGGFAERKWRVGISGVSFGWKAAHTHRRNPVTSGSAPSPKFELRRNPCLALSLDKDLIYNP